MQAQRPRDRTSGCGCLARALPAVGGRWAGGGRGICQAARRRPERRARRTGTKSAPREAEATGNAFGLLWHLDRLAEQRPDDWRLAARRGTALADSEDFAAGEAAFVFAARNGAGTALADWHSHAAAVAAGAGGWHVARWHLDRQVAARPNDWRPYAERAEVHGRAGRSAERDADLEQAVALGAEQSLVLRLAESRVSPASVAKGRRILPEGSRPEPLAAACSASVRAGMPRERRPGRPIASYARGWSSLPARPRAPEIANAIAWTCAVGPKAVEDFDPVVALAEGAVKAGGDARALHNRLNTLALCCPRRPLSGSEPAPRRKHSFCGKGAEALDWLLLALVHLGLDEPAEAEKCLAKVPQPTPREGGVSWADVEIEGLRREVQTRLKQRPEAQSLTRRLRGRPKKQSAQAG